MIKKPIDEIWLVESIVNLINTNNRLSFYLISLLLKLADSILINYLHCIRCLWEE